ncbi:Hypothetical protein AKI40_4697 [Enterobacter sp. FY-07]|nr:Hypothetical protein AKI40_4697 [Enterobacter sp. FY-07]
MSSALSPGTALPLEMFSRRSFVTGCAPTRKLAHCLRRCTLIYYVLTTGAGCKCASATGMWKMFTPTAGVSALAYALAQPRYGRRDRSGKVVTHHMEENGGGQTGEQQQTALQGNIFNPPDGEEAETREYRKDNAEQRNGVWRVTLLV